MVELSQELYAVAFAGGLEGTGTPWPGALILAATGVSLEEGGAGLLLLTTAFAAGYSLGALGQYALGRVLGSMVMGWLPEAQQRKLNHLMARYGTSAVLWSRPLAIGNYVSLPAGIMRMPLATFALYTFLGAWPWALATVLAGRFLGSQVILFQELAARWTIPALVTAGTVTVILGAWRIRSRRPAGDAPARVSL